MDSSMSDALPVLGILGVFLVTFLIMLIPQIFYLLTLQKTLNKVKEANRGMTPGLVWLNLVPLFSLGWHFYVVAKMKESLANEYKDRGLTGDDDFGYKLGLTMCILAVCGIIPFIGGIAGLACLVVWILYWIKIANYSRELDNPVTEAVTTEETVIEETTEAPAAPSEAEKPQGQESPASPESPPSGETPEPPQGTDGPEDTPKTDHPQT
jgi:hypothetical protein